MYKKIILLIIIFFTFSVSFASDNVKIGLEYNKEINEAIITSSQNFYVNINDDKLIDLDKNILKIYKNNEFYLKINQKFDRLEDALIILDSLNKKGQTCFLFYDNSWEIYTGNYNSIDEAKAHNNNNFDIVLPNSKNIIVKNSDNKIIFSYNSESDISFTSGEIIEFGSKYFRGSFMFKRCKESDFTIINKLPIEEYLYGVISKEMPANWPIEALKAQAIAARNFTVSNLGKYSDLGFDLTDDINSQVYGGYDAESEKIKLAVDETFNMLLRSNSNNNIVSAYYHSNSGGQTESIENVWQTQVPYLVGVKDEYSENVQNSNWSKKYTLHEISNKLNEAGYDVGEIYDVEMASVSQNYRILEIIFKGSRNNIILEKGETRKVLGYYDIKSMWFDVKKDNEIQYVNDKKYLNAPVNSMEIITKDGIKKISNYSTYSVFDGKVKKDIAVKINEIEFVGKGFGHGVGMSQWGANVMANRGFNYEEILLHYYTGTYLDRSIK